MKSPPISVLLPTYNCADSVRDTLESVKWAEEIFVVDSYSTDDTLKICREFGTRIVQHEYVNSARQKNRAATQCKHEWVFQIDSDETLEPGLREEIDHAVGVAAVSVHAFQIPRKNHVLGKWMRFGGVYPDYQIRLFRKDVGRWAEREVHAHVTVPGKILTLRHHLVHNGMPTISKQLKNLDRYTRYEADQLSKEGKRFGWYQVIFRPWLIFLRRYFWQQGFREGWRGLIVCAYLAIYDFLVRVKLWELQELQLRKLPQ